MSEHQDDTGVLLREIRELIVQHSIIELERTQLDEAILALLQKMADVDVAAGDDPVLVAIARMNAEVAHLAASFTKLADAISRS